MTLDASMGRGGDSGEPFEGLMKPHTIVVIRIETGFEKIEKFKDAFRLQITGFSVRDAEGGGLSTIVE